MSSRHQPRDSCWNPQGSRRRPVRPRQRTQRPIPRRVRACRQL